MKCLSAVAVKSILMLSTCFLTVAAAQTYPSKPLRFVVPFAPGGGADTLGRLVSQKVAESLGQQVIVDNRGGAGGNVAAEVVARALPDGYTLLQANVAHAISASLYRKLNYDLIKDFAPITLLASSPYLLMVNPAVQASSVKELIALAKARPGQLTYGSSGTGGHSHLLTELFNSMAGVKVRHVPYKGAGPAMIDLIAGQIQISFNTLGVALPLVKSGKLKGLAVTSSRRVPEEPGYPTIAEAGVNGYEALTWYGVMAPAKTPNSIIEKLHKEFTAALNSPDLKGRLADLSFEPVVNTPTQFAEYVRSEIPKWAAVVKSTAAKAD